MRGLRRIEMEALGNLGPSLVVAGLATVSIEGLDDSEQDTYVAEVGDNLLGVCYFHALYGHEVVWDLGNGEMAIVKKSH